MAHPKCWLGRPKVEIAGYACCFSTANLGTSTMASSDFDNELQPEIAVTVTRTRSTVVRFSAYLTIRFFILPG